MSKTIIPNSTQKKLLNTREAARRAGLSAYFIRQLCEKKKIVAYFVLGKWRVDPVSLDRYMAKQMNVDM